MRLVSPNVREAYCISRKRKMCTLLCNWQLPRRYVSMQLFWQMGQTRGNRVVGWRQLSVGLSLGSVWGPLQRTGLNLTTEVIFFTGTPRWTFAWPYKTNSLQTLSDLLISADCMAPLRLAHCSSFNKQASFLIDLPRRATASVFQQLPHFQVNTYIFCDYYNGLQVLMPKLI